MSTANQQQHEAWNGEGGHRWVADADRRDDVLTPVADVLLAAATLRSGESVVDIGCGCGATTIAAADAVAPGAVVGLDLSAPMLDLARRRTADRQIEFRQADAQTDSLATAEFDVAVSRFGTMFFDDPTAAFVNIRRAMRPAGRLCIATWQPLGANDWLLVPGAALLHYGTLPAAASAAGPGMFAQSDPATVEHVLHAAGWNDIDVEPVTVTLRLGRDAHDATDYLADTGVARAVLDTIDPERRDEAIAAVMAALADHEGSSGVELAAGIHLVRAVA